MAYAGRSLAPYNGVSKVTGRGRFASDMALDDCLHAAVLRSPVAHARVRSVDVSAVLADATVIVLTRAELGLDDRVRQYGDVIAVVAAAATEAATRALSLIDYELEELPVVSDPLTAGAGPALYDDHPDNVALEMSTTLGDPDEGLASADLVVEETYRSGRPTHCNLARHCCIARALPDGGVEVMTSVDSPQFARMQLARALGIEPDRVRITLPELLTSSFGGRSEISPLCEPLAARLALHTEGRPVRLLYDTEEELVAGHTRHAAVFAFRTGVATDGRLLAMELDAVIDHGAFPNFVARIVLSNCRDRVFDLYELDNFRFDGRAMLTNNLNAAEMRGIGVTQFLYALGSHLDEVAHRVGIDPVAFHKRNAARPGRLHPISGVPVATASIATVLDAGADAVEWAKRSPDTTDGRIRHGTGVGLGSYTTGLGTFHGPDRSAARLRLSDRGEVELYVLAPDSGQGGTTVYAQLVADEAGIPFEWVRFGAVDTSSGPDDPWGSVASRGVYVVGAAVRAAGRALRERLAQAAALAFEVDPASIMIDDGWAATRDDPRRRIDVRELAATTGSIEVEGASTTEDNPCTYGAYFAEVEVDTETGLVQLVRMVAALDVGYAVNPPQCEGQIVGAAAMGAEFVLGSELMLEDGVPINANLVEYRLLRAPDLPSIQPIVIESNADQGPAGAQGIGTPAIVPSAPAICNAIRAATGYRVHDIPIAASHLQAELAKAAADSF